MFIAVIIFRRQIYIEFSVFFCRQLRDLNRFFNNHPVILPKFHFCQVKYCLMIITGKEPACNCKIGFLSLYLGFICQNYLRFLRYLLICPLYPKIPRIAARETIIMIITPEIGESSPVCGVSFSLS